MDNGRPVQFSSCSDLNENKRKKGGTGMEYRALLDQCYRTVDPIRRQRDFSAVSDNEAVGMAIGFVGPLEWRYGISLRAVARKENGTPTMVIFEDGRRVEKSIDPITLRSA